LIVPDWFEQADVGAHQASFYLPTTIVVNAIIVVIVTEESHALLTRRVGAQIVTDGTVQTSFEPDFKSQMDVDLMDLVTSNIPGAYGGKEGTTTHAGIINHCALIRYAKRTSGTAQIVSLGGRANTVFDGRGLNIFPLCINITDTRPLLARDWSSSQLRGTRDSDGQHKLFHSDIMAIETAMRVKLLRADRSRLSVLAIGGSPGEHFSEGYLGCNYNYDLTIVDPRDTAVRRHHKHHKDYYSDELYGGQDCVIMDVRPDRDGEDHDDWQKVKEANSAQMIQWAEHIVSVNPEVVISIKYNSLKDIDVPGELMGQIFHWSESLETRLLIFPGCSRTILTGNEYVEQCRRWNDYRRGRDASLVDMFTSGAFLFGSYLDYTIKTAPTMAFYTLSSMGNPADTVARVLRAYNVAAFSLTVPSFEEAEQAQISLSKDGWTDSAARSLVRDTNGFMFMNVPDAIYFLSQGVTSTKAVEVRKRGRLNHAFFFRPADIRRAFPLWEFQTTDFNPTVYVKLMTGIYRRFPGMLNDTLLKLREKAFLRYWADNQPELSEEFETTGFMTDELGRHRVNTAGHMINMLLAHGYYQIDARFFAGVIEANLAWYSATRSGKKLTRNQREVKRLWSRNELSETGIPPWSLYHSYYDHLTAIQCVRNEYRALGFIVPEDILDWMEQRLYKLRGLYPHFTDDAFVQQRR
jgi:hypothetical protein